MSLLVVGVQSINDLYTPIQDTNGRSDLPDTNFGTAATISIGRRASETRTAYITIDVTNITNEATIIEAILFLFETSGGFANTQNTSIYYVNTTAIGDNSCKWSQNLLTWNNQPAGNTIGANNLSCLDDTIVDGHLTGASNSFVNWNVTKHIQFCVDNSQTNCSMAISNNFFPQTSGVGEFNTVDNVANKPFINITWDEPTPAPTDPFFSNNITNNSQPRQNDHIALNITINQLEVDLDVWVFSWDNGTGTFINDSLVQLAAGSRNVNVSKVKTIFNITGTEIRWIWYANDSSGTWNNSGIQRLTVAGLVTPNATLQPDNFFNEDNLTIISLTTAQAAILNISFADDVDLFGFEINISDPLGNIIFNLTNTNLSGKNDNYAATINVLGPQGFYNVNMTVWDTHTARRIDNFNINAGIGNSIVYDGHLKITAEGAIYAKTTKFIDSFDFQFTYIPFFSPKIKTFIVETNGPLNYVKTSGYEGHLVDWKNRKWIDFEGVEGDIVMEQIAFNKWKITIAHEGNKIKFNSVGQLNSNNFGFTYYVSNTTLNYVSPPNIISQIFGNNFNVSLNVTGNGRNTTFFRIYNSTNTLFATVNVTNTGTGSFFYNATFNNLVDNTYFINATHIDIVGQSVNSTTLTVQLTQLTNCSLGVPTINYTFRDEKNNSIIKASSTVVYTFNNSFTFTRTANSLFNFSTCIFPTDSVLQSDYTATSTNPEYPQRVTTIEDITLSSTLQTKNLFLLKDTDGIFGTFRIVSAVGTTLPDVIVSYTKTGQTDKIEQKITDDSGIVTFFVNPEQSYDFTFKKAGFVTLIATLTITTTEPRDITMTAISTGVDISFKTGIDYFQLPTPQILANKTNYTFIFNISSTFWNISACRLELSNASESLAKANGITNGSNCVASINLNTNNQSFIKSFAEWSLNNTQNDTTFINYDVKNVFKGQFSLANFIDDLNAFTSAGFNSETKFLIAFILTLLLVGAFAALSSDFRSEEVLITTTIVIVFFFSYIGWFNLNIISAPTVNPLAADFLERWITFILILLSGGGYLIKKNTS